MAEVGEHPHIAGCVRQGPDVVHKQLVDYTMELVRQHDLPLSQNEVRVACMMLQGSLFADAMGRDIMSDLYPRPSRAGKEYARAFLRMVGHETGPARERGARIPAGRVTKANGRPASQRRNGHGRQSRPPRAS
jgi:hypothetical protein